MNYYVNLQEAIDHILDILQLGWWVFGTQKSSSHMEIKAQASFSRILEMEQNDSLKPQNQPSLSSLRKTTGKLRKYYLYGNIFNTDKTRAVVCKEILCISSQLVSELSAQCICIRGSDSTPLI